MSAAKAFRKPAILAAQLLAAMLGWAFIAPIALLIPKARGSITVIGRNGGKFCDNSKYFYLQAQNLLPAHCRCVFLTSTKAESELLTRLDLPAQSFPSLKGAWLLLRSRLIVVDSFDWHSSMRRFLTLRARRVQLWHGVGFKRIERDKVRNEVPDKTMTALRLLWPVRLLTRRIIGRDVRYDLVNTTSQFYLREVFKPAFNSHHFSAVGYPRNTFGRGSLAALLNADKHIMAKLPNWESTGKRLVVVAPTFRESRASPTGLDMATLRHIDQWCETHNAEFIFKFHPWERGSGEVNGVHLHCHDPDADIYPLMLHACALITDYSSIYMDFITLDRPVFFLAPDIDEYVATDRQLQFDYASMTPGPKSRDWTSMLTQIASEWGSDSYAEERKRLRELAFDNLDQDLATPKLLDIFKRNHWI